MNVAKAVYVENLMAAIGQPSPGWTLRRAFENLRDHCSQHRPCGCCEVTWAHAVISLARGWIDIDDLREIRDEGEEKSECPCCASISRVAQQGVEAYERAVSMRQIRESER